MLTDLGAAAGVSKLPFRALRGASNGGSLIMAKNRVSSSSQKQRPKQLGHQKPLGSLQSHLQHEEYAAAEVRRLGPLGESCLAAEIVATRTRPPCNCRWYAPSYPGPAALAAAAAVHRKAIIIIAFTHRTTAAAAAAVAEVHHPLNCIDHAALQSHASLAFTETFVSESKYGTTHTVRCSKVCKYGTAGTQRNNTTTSEETKG